VTGFAGGRLLLLLALRRDRWMVPAWILTFVAVVGFTAVASGGLYASDAAMRRAAQGWNSTAAAVAMHERIYDTSSLGAAVLAKPMGLGTAMVGLLALLLVVRHTRADEEIGRTELAAGGVVGRLAPLAAALGLATGTVATLSVLSGATLVASGLPLKGALAFAGAWTGAGCVFAGVGACAAQLTTSSRAARGAAATVLAVAHVVRACGDTRPPGGARWISWLSPIGWAQQVRPFAGDRFAVLLLLAVGAGGAVLVSFVLQARRDLGAGLFADRAGPESGQQLVSMRALAWRLQRAALLAWATGAALLGLLLGGIASTVQDLLTSSAMQDYVRTLGGTTALADAFLSTELSIVGVAVAGYGISAAMRMHSEETQGRVEPVLATGVSRLSFVSSHLGVAVLGTSLLMLVTGAAMGASYAVSVGDGAEVLRLVAAALVRLPAVWVLTAVVILLHGVAQRWASLAWAVLVAVLVVGEFGPLMRLPAWTLNLSPFEHLPELPGGTFDAVPLLATTGLALALCAIGGVAYARRDIY
jgi:ABC-2 type transport system permease protein